MNIAALFIGRPVATTLLTIGIVLAGMLAYARLPVSPLPQVDYPTIQVRAQMAGASPETMGNSVAAPLERHLGQIADVTEMTSQSSVGQTRIVLQFGLDRDINGAARDVQAAINAARADLPTSLRSNPTYNKVNPSDAPIVILALTSETLTKGQLYDAASNVLQQKLSQLPGIGEVDIAGSALPAVRVELNPTALFHYGIGLEDVRAALASANANAPKGAIEDGPRHFQIYTNDQASHADDYKPLVIAYRNSAAVRLADVADVVDSVEDLRNAGLSGGKPAVLVIMYRQPGANIIDTVDGVKAALPALEAAMPGDVVVSIANDRSTTIRSSLSDTQRTLIIAVILVVGVVFAFLREPRAALIPSISVPVSIIGTFALMYLLGFSLDNLSLMALTIATGFVVDDAIVVVENVMRHLEAGVPRIEAARRGAGEVVFTVVAMSTSLIAVFLPILLMGGLVGRLLREFALTLSLAIGVSLAISLTTTPMLCAILLRPQHGVRHGRVWRVSERAFTGMQSLYARTLDRALRHPWLVIATLLATIGLNVALYVIVPKGFFPQQDTGRLIGAIQGDQSISFQAMRAKVAQMQRIVAADPAVASVVGFTGGRQTNAGVMFVALKPLSERRLSADQVIGRLRRKLNIVAGARLFLQSVQDIRIGGRQSNAQYQFALTTDDSATLYEWTPKLTQAISKIAGVTDVSSDQQQGGMETMLTIDRPTAARLGLTPALIDNTLYDAFGQRQVSTIYNALNQYHVVMEVAPQYWQSPETLRSLWVSQSGASASGTQSSGIVSPNVATTGTAATGTAASGGTEANATASSTDANANAVQNAATNAIAASGKSATSSGAAVSTARETMVPLSAVASFAPAKTPLSVNHQGMFVASTISFNLAPGVSLGSVSGEIRQAMAEIGMPASITGNFAGSAATFQASLKTQPLLIAAALAAVYIVLGVLYESFIHPLTILSTLPSAGVGAVAALMLFHSEFSIIALIGVILLIGIVKKNAIMMIDFAVQTQREDGVSSFEAIRSACLLRFRPIMMTTAAALLGALPLAFGSGEGSELRTPLGISIVGGLIFSQLLTLYTTPVIYLELDRLATRRRGPRAAPANPAPGIAE